MCYRNYILHVFIINWGIQKVPLEHNRKTIPEKLENIFWTNVRTKHFEKRGGGEIYQQYHTPQNNLKLFV